MRYCKKNHDSHLQSSDFTTFRKSLFSHQQIKFIYYLAYTFVACSLGMSNSCRFDGKSPSAGKNGPRRREKSTPAPGKMVPGAGVEFSRRRGPLPGAGVHFSRRWAIFPLKRTIFPLKARIRDTPRPSKKLQPWRMTWQTSELFPKF